METGKRVKKNNGYQMKNNSYQNSVSKQKKSDINHLDLLSAIRYLLSVIWHPESEKFGELNMIKLVIETRSILEK